jgi:hypothetical protein
MSEMHDSSRLSVSAEKMDTQAQACTAGFCYAPSTGRFRGVPGVVKSTSAVIVVISDSFPDGPTALTPNTILPATSGNDEMSSGSVTSVTLPTST